jgi:molecular chaperone GrpE (heat shock protein)
MREPLEGLDATAEAETSMADVEPASTPDFDSLRRALRDLEAAKARVERDARHAADEMREKLVAELLPVLDNLDRTIRAAEAGSVAQSMVQGVRQVRTQFAGVLARFGVERFDAKHQRFDPRMHDAVSVVPVVHPSAHDVVVDQIEPGYRFGDRLLRPAKVVVGRLAPRYH